MRKPRPDSSEDILSAELIPRGVKSSKVPLLPASGSAAGPPRYPSLRSSTAFAVATGLDGASVSARCGAGTRQERPRPVAPPYYGRPANAAPRDPFKGPLSGSTASAHAKWCPGAPVPSVRYSSARQTDVHFRRWRTRALQKCRNPGPKRRGWRPKPLPSPGESLPQLASACCPALGSSRLCSFTRPANYGVIGVILLLARKGWLNRRPRVPALPTTNRPHRRRTRGLQRTLMAMQTSNSVHQRMWAQLEVPKLRKASRKGPRRRPGELPHRRSPIRALRPVLLLIRGNLWALSPMQAAPAAPTRAARATSRSPLESRR